MSDTFNLHRGTDFEVAGTFGADLTDWTLTLFEPTADIASFLIPTLTDEATGAFRLRMEWDVAIPQRSSFRLKLTPPASAFGEITTNRLTIMVI